MEGGAGGFWGRGWDEMGMGWEEGEARRGDGMG